MVGLGSSLEQMLHVFFPPSLSPSYILFFPASELPPLFRLSLNRSGQEPPNQSLYLVLSCPRIRLTSGPSFDLPEI